MTDRERHRLHGPVRWMRVERASIDPQTGATITPFDAQGLRTTVSPYRPRIPRHDSTEPRAAHDHVLRRISRPPSAANRTAIPTSWSSWPSWLKNSVLRVTASIRENRFLRSLRYLRDRRLSSWIRPSGW